MGWSVIATKVPIGGVIVFCIVVIPSVFGFEKHVAKAMRVLPAPGMIRDAGPGYSVIQLLRLERLRSERWPCSGDSVGDILPLEVT